MNKEQLREAISNLREPGFEAKMRKLLKGHLSEEVIEALANPIQNLHVQGETELEKKLLRWHRCQDLDTGNYLNSNIDHAEEYRKLLQLWPSLENLLMGY